MGRKETFVVDPAWKKQGVMLAFSHFDDESLLLLVAMEMLRHDIPMTFLSATYGEVGKDRGVYRPPSEMREIRKSEYEHATDAVGVNREMLDLGDFWLKELPYHQLIVPILKVIRQVRPAAIFTFNPFEANTRFYHPDHNRLAEGVFDAASAMDIPDRYPESGTATDFRSQLYAWTVNQDQATHVIPFPEGYEQYSELRAAYLKMFYSSQFTEQDEVAWRKYFDELDRTDDGQHEYKLIKIRD